MSREYSYDFCKLVHDGKELRILEIIDSGHELIECRLVKHDGITPYHALSWCWGASISEENQAMIKIIHEDNTYDYTLTGNLAIALRRLRDLRNPFNKGMPWIKRIWIDYICINQANTAEKNIQVPMMADIYSKAESVFVWLGEEKDKSTEAIKFIKNHVLNIQGFDELVTDKRFSTEWAALNNLMKRNWFSRRWVVQEIALAKDAELLCGDQTINWREFADAVSLFNQAETQSRALTELMRNEKRYGHKADYFGHIPAFSATRLVNETNNLFLRRDGGESGNREARLSLEYLVSNFTGFHASQPRDTVYALLAIAKDTSPQVRETVKDKEGIPYVLRHLRNAKFQRQTYNVDYAQPISDVYVQFMKFSIGKAEQSRALDIICRPWVPDPKRQDQPDEEHYWRAVFDEEGEDHSKRPKGEGLDTIPSWIRSVSGDAYGRQEDDGKMTRINANTLVGAPPHRPYMAAGSRVVTDKLRFEDGITNFSNFEDIIGTHYHSMFVEGFVLDKVKKRGPASQGGNIPEEWHKLAKIHQSKQSDTKVKLPEDFWRTLVGDRDPLGNNAPRFYPRLIQQALKTVEKGDKGVYRDFHTQQSINDNDVKLTGEVLRRVQSVVWNRRLTLTEGSRIGLIPKRAREGDLICILYGCSVPVLLRKYEKTEDEIADEKRQKLRNAQQAEDRKRQEAARTIQRAFRKKHPLPFIGVGDGGKVLEQKETSHTSLEERAGSSEHTTPGQKSPTQSPPLSSRSRVKSMLHSRTSPRTKTVQATKSPHWGLSGAYTPSFHSQSSTNGDGIHKNAESLQDPYARSRCASKCEFTTCSKCGHAKPASKKEAAASTTSATGKTLEEDDGVFYQLIGECYIHGMMNGEALDLQSANLKTNPINRILFEIR